MQIIEESRIEEFEQYSLEFEWVHSPGAGYSFPCDERGNLDWGNIPMESLCRCILDDRLLYRGIRCERWSYQHPAVGRCECGREVELGSFTNTCECGRDYNSAGQLLAPRCQWGEETGEHWSECY